MQTRKRIVIHFPGFEALDAKAHLLRFKQTARQSGETYGFQSEVGPLDQSGGTPRFDVSSAGPNWQTHSVIYLLDDVEAMRRFSAQSNVRRLVAGVIAAAKIIAAGGLYRYLRVSWRFAVFSLFPYAFALMVLGAVVAMATIPFLFGLDPINTVWSVPLALFGLFKLLLPLADRFYIWHLFDGARDVVNLASLDDPQTISSLARMERSIQEILAEPADEYLLTAHSRGGTMAILTLGNLLKHKPDLLKGKQVSLVTLGGSGLHVALLSTAVQLRERYRTILTTSGLTWLDYQCLTDPINFYKSRPANTLGFEGVKEPISIRIRVRDMVSKQSYKSIWFDMLRIHRQYVLGSDKRTRYDFTLLTCGPFSAGQFVNFIVTGVPLDKTGALKGLGKSPAPALDL